MRLTYAQRRALSILHCAPRHQSAKTLRIRSDVLWRLEERGFAGRNMHNQWYITNRGRVAMREDAR